jgi:7-cyano-7-deazaguanine synthase
MSEHKAIVLLSGGQDSTTCLHWAIKEFAGVTAIGFDYGQRHRVELDYARSNAEDAGVAFRVMDVRGLLAPSSLTDGQGQHNAASHINAELPASFTAGRNLLFLTVAASVAAGLGINDIVTGVCQTDYLGFPDCRRSTIDAMQVALTLGAGNGDIRIHTPLMYLTKAETWKLAADLGILETIINRTMTDYSGSTTPNEWGMGYEDNPASILRASGYREAKANNWIP